jgi:hypothetical protein
MSKSWKRGVPRRYGARGTEAMVPRTQVSTSLDDTDVPDLLQQRTFNRGGLWNETDATGAEPARQETEHHGFSQSPWGLAEKFISGRVQSNPRNVIVLVVLAWFGFAGWLFVKDSSVGKLESLTGYVLFLEKLGFFSILTLLVCLIIWFVLRPGKQSNAA